MPHGCHRATPSGGGRVGVRLSFCDPQCIASSPSPSSDEFIAESAAIENIRRVHREQLERARRRAQVLVDDAAASTEDGIRDLVDEDAEADAAADAALVRQSAAQAMYGYRRLQELDDAGDALAFGHITGDDGRRLTVGRISVIDGDDALLVDWRARAAIPFYRATPLDRLGVRRRRHLLYGDGTDVSVDSLVGWSDELFDPDDLATGDELRGEAAILAALAAPTEDQMRSVVATIQAEQDAVIRSPADGPLVVQGGPGTGKTVVALHRAAYLLYDQRAALADAGVLIVGPTPEFLTYISRVLPSLGESGVISVTPDELYPGIRLGRDEPAEVSALKGRRVMADLLANAVNDRRRPFVGELDVWYGTVRVRLGVAELDVLAKVAGRQRAHNDGARVFRSDLVDMLARKADHPSFSDLDDAIAAFDADPAVEELCLRHWPPLTPEQALNDLLGSKALLASAARGTDLTRAELTSLHRPRTHERDLVDAQWSAADVALLDELLHLLGPVDAEIESDRTVERDLLDVFDVADAVEQATGADDDPEDEGDLDLTDGDVISLDDVDGLAAFEDPWWDDE